MQCQPQSMSTRAIGRQINHWHTVYRYACDTTPGNTQDNTHPQGRSCNNKRKKTRILTRCHLNDSWHFENSKMSHFQQQKQTFSCRETLTSSFQGKCQNDPKFRNSWRNLTIRVKVTRFSSRPLTAFFLGGLLGTALKRRFSHSVFLKELLMLMGAHIYTTNTTALESYRRDLSTRSFNQIFPKCHVFFVATPDIFGGLLGTALEFPLVSRRKLLILI